MPEFAKQPADQVAVGKGNVNGAPSDVPGKRTLTQDLTAYSHVDPRAPRVPDDERRPFDWTRGFQLVVPGGPMVARRVVPGPECPKAPNSVPTRVWDCHSSASAEPRLGNPIVITSDHAEHRQRCWSALIRIAVPLQARHDATVPEIAAYFAAERDPRLAALGILVPRGRMNATLASLVNCQELPTRGGHTLESLFRPNGKLDIATDSPAVQRAASGAGDDRYLAVTAADKQLEGMLSHVKAAAEHVKATAEGVDRVREQIELEAARYKETEAEAEVRELGERAKGVKEMLGFMNEGTDVVLRLIEHGAGALLGGPMIGSLCTMVCNALTAGPLAEAKKRLAAAREEVNTRTASVLRHSLSEALALHAEAVLELDGRHFHLEGAMATRRVTYNKAGEHAGKLAGGDEGAMIAAAYAAYPLAETVHGVAAGIVRQLEHACPDFDPQAAEGLGIGVFHRDEAALEFPEAVRDQMTYGWYFRELRDDWTGILGEFRGLRTSIEGVRPGGQ